MPDRFRHPADPDKARTRFARRSIQLHAEREWVFLDLAVNANDDESSALYELCADDAYRDAHAIAQEHDLAW